MAKAPSPKLTPAPSPSPSPDTASSLASSSSLGGSASATDQVDAEVVKGTGGGATTGEGEPVAQEEESVDAGAGATRETPVAHTHLGPALNEITTPEAAVSALKAKLSILHTIGHNASHYSTLAFNDVEQLLADVRWLVSYIRSKV